MSSNLSFWFPRRARRGLENKSYLDEGRMEKLEQMLKQTEQIANEAEAKYEEVRYEVGIIEHWTK